ncbi:hypothetical protein Slin15195_G032510 [Septoria linicola]|uniref:Uncharacterized protein n=1 Tax=Septoria linicola TaxID=215465 RepID=A0A9Q9APY6_9PEZI|nr:hypothetical protein Slin14017_G031540 [Septoria linicola]USW49932.1 hypothetical protein Slin15195_G032510 [Septoria linicola]
MEPISLSAGTHLIRKRQVNDDDLEGPAAKRTRLADEAALREMTEDQATREQSSSDDDLWGESESDNFECPEMDEPVQSTGLALPTSRPRAEVTNVVDSVEPDMPAHSGVIDEDEAFEAQLAAEIKAQMEEIDPPASIEPELPSCMAQAKAPGASPVSTAAQSRPREQSRKRKSRKNLPKPKAVDLKAKATAEHINAALGKKRGGNLTDRFTATHEAAVKPGNARQGDASHPIDLDGNNDDNPIIILDDDSEQTAPQPSLSAQVAPATPPQRRASLVSQLLTPRATPSPARQPSPPKESKVERRARLALERQRSKEAQDAYDRAFMALTPEQRARQIEASRVAAGHEARVEITCTQEGFQQHCSQEKRDRSAANMREWRARRPKPAE